MGLLFKAGIAFASTAWFLVYGPFSWSAEPRWDAVRAELAAPHPWARLAVQAETPFQAGMPLPAADETVR